MGKREQIGDQLSHIPGAVADDIQQPAAFAVQTTRVVFLENPRESVDGPERRLEIVRDGIRERLQFTVRDFEFRSAVRDEFFEIVAMLSQLLFGLLSFGNVKTMTDVAHEFPFAVVAWATVVEDPPVFAVVAAQAIFDAECLPPVECSGVNFQTALHFVRMNPFRPAVPDFLFERAPREFEPDAIEIVTEFIRAGCPYQRLAGIRQSPAALFVFPQLLFGLLSFCDVVHHDAAYGCSVCIPDGRCRHMRPEYGSVRFCHAQLALLRFAGAEEMSVVQIVDVPVLFEDETDDRLPEQRVPGDAQQGCYGQVGFEDQPLFGNGAIAHGRQVIEVEIACPRRVQFHLHPAQFRILHLQFDLMDMQFVEHLPRFRRWDGFRGFRRMGDLFGPTAQFCCVSRCSVVPVFHCAPPLLRPVSDSSRPVPSSQLHISDRLHSSGPWRSSIHPRRRLPW